MKLITRVTKKTQRLLSINFLKKVFVHVFDNCSQDSSAVLCIIENIVQEIHLSDPVITKALLRSDNAGYYHSAGTLLSLPYLSKKTGIEVQRIDFSDPQGGKSPCDRFVAVLKPRVQRYLNEKNVIIKLVLIYFEHTISIALSSLGLESIIITTRMNR